MVISKKSSHKIFYTLLFALSAMILARYAFSIEIPRIILTAVIVLTAMIGDRDEILAICMCCIPFHESVDFYTAIMLCAIVFVIKNPRRIRVGLPVILGIAIIFWEVLHCFSSDLNIRLLLASIAPLIFFVMVISTDIEGIDYAFIVRAMAVSAVAVSVFCLLNVFVQVDFNFAKAILNLRRLGVIAEDDTLVGGKINPNTLGIINVLVTTGLLQLRNIGKRKKIDYFLIIILLVFGVLTSSRTFLVCLLIMLLLFIIGQKGDVSKKIRFLVLLIVGGAVALFILNLLFPSVLEYYIGRFQVDDITAGRDILLVDYNNFITDNLWVMLFGLGATDLGTKVIYEYNVASNTPHNSIQEIIVAWGIPGLIMISLLLIFAIYESKRYVIRKTIINYIPLIIILAKSMAGQLITSGYTILALSFAYLSLCQNFGESNNAQNQVNNSVESNTEIL